MVALPNESSTERLRSSQYSSRMDSLGKADMFRLLGQFELERYPRRTNETLQAWDAADELILRKLEDRGETIGNVLIVNDSWGALSVALADHRPSALSDSYLAHAATRRNLAKNHMDSGAVRLLTSF